MNEHIFSQESIDSLWLCVNIELMDFENINKHIVKPINSIVLMRSLWILENIEESHHQPEFITIPFWLRRFKTEIEETHYQPESVIVVHVALFQDGIYIKYRHLATCYNTELMGLEKHKQNTHY